jgi:exodeoxyribonuclease V gamma subunit
MRIVESNRLDVLADDLLGHWRKPTACDLSATTIVVPSLGVGRWLTFRIASAFSVCAQVEFAYPATYVWKLFAAILPELSSQSPFDTATLTWRLYRLFGRIRPSAEFLPLSSYLSSADPRDRLGLARRVAALYGEVLALRPEWAPNWQRGRLSRAEPAEHERWLAALWRLLAKEISAAGELHPRDAVLQRLKDDPALAGALPERITVFAVPHMVPLYQSVFEALSSYCEVTAYLINPSPEFWFDLESDQRRARRLAAAQTAFDFEPDGQRLLAALGKQAKENLSIWGIADADRQGADLVLEERFIEPSGQDLLSRLKSEIYGAIQSDRKFALDRFDRSIEVHVCHSLTRQLEVLHDQLLDAFERHADRAERLRPAEVLVLLPDIDAAAPLIDAVFGAAPAPRHIPYVVSGRAPGDASPLINAFFAILSLPFGRFAASEVIDLLSLPAIALSFGISEAMRERMVVWLKETGVHWGLDAHTKERAGLPANSRHTFAEGIAELYLGYASASDRPALIDGLLPYPGIEGKDAEALGVLSRYLAAIAALPERLAVSRSTASWTGELNRLLEQFFLRRADEARELSRLDAALSSVAKAAASVGFDEPITLAVMIDAVRHALSEGAPGAVPSGSVTFCGFGGLRQLPYRFIAMLDLNGDGSFPRNPDRAEFDLLRRQPRPGDRLLVDEDRGAFLDALLAAEERVYCSYNGHSIRDNAVLPPSSVLDDLIDSLSQLTEGGREALADQVLIEHPLQSFSERYFDATASSPEGVSRIFSFASEVAIEPHALGDAPGFFDGSLPDAGQEWREVSLSSLVRALNDPIRFLLEERLGLDLWDDNALISDEEPDRIAPLERRGLRERLFRLYQSGVRSDALLSVAAAFPQVPEGVMGQIALAPEVDVAALFAKAVDAMRPATLTSQRFVLDRGPFRLYGALDGLHPGGRFDAALTDLKSRDLVGLWLSHLVLQLLALDDQPNARGSMLVGARQIASFAPTDEAKERLDDLLEIYWQSLHQATPLIPDVSFEFVSAASKDPLKTARKRFAPSQGFAPAEKRAYRIAYGRVLTDLPEGFADISKRVYAPLCRDLSIRSVAAPLELDDDDRRTSRAVQEHDDG